MKNIFLRIYIQLSEIDVVCCLRWLWFKFKKNNDIVT